MRNNIKGSNIQEIIKRSKDAMDKGFYIECLMLSAAIVEERIISVLNKLGLNVTQSVTKNLLLLIKESKKSNSPYTILLGSEIDELDLLSVISKRNDIVHNLVDSSSLINYNETESVAIKMHVRMTLLCSSVIRWKNQWSKESK